MGGSSIGWGVSNVTQCRHGSSFHPSAPLFRPQVREQDAAAGAHQEADRVAVPAVRLPQEADCQGPHGVGGMLLLLLLSSHLKTIPVSPPSTPFVRTDPTDTANSRGHRVLSTST